jgi:zinc-ribbon domain
MYCPQCAAQLVDSAKFCRACGADIKAVALALADQHLPARAGKKKNKAPKPEKSWMEQAEERFDEYLEGLFWITVFGLGIIIGGAALLTKVLHFNRGVVIAYLVLSSMAFLINFGMNLWMALRLARSLKKADGEYLPAPRDTNKILPAEGAMPGESAQSGAPSITENTTRSLEPIPK